MSFHIQSSEERVQKVTSTFPAPHLVAPQLGERFLSREEAKERFQNWAFTQGVALVVESKSLSRGSYILECTRHHKETRNTRDIAAEDRKRGTKVNSNGCKFRLVIKHVKESNVWTLEKMQLDHNHAPQSDPFQLFPHRHKDPGRQEAKEVGQSLRTANIPFSQARRTMLAKGVSLSKDDYYNLSKFEGRLSEQDQRIYAIASLERMDFHVRCYERYELRECRSLEKERGKMIRRCKTGL